MVDVFISYRTTERSRVEPILARLAEFDLDIFFDIEKIDSREPFPDILDRALKASTAVLCCWSPAYFQSDWCKKECRFAVDRGRLIAVRLEAFVPDAQPFYLNDINYYDLTDWSGDAAHANWRRVLRDLGGRLGRELSPAQPALHAHEDLRATWRSLAVGSDISTIERFLEVVQRGAAHSGLEFEIESRLATLRRQEAPPPPPPPEAPPVINWDAVRRSEPEPARWVETAEGRRQRLRRSLHAYSRAIETGEEDEPSDKAPEAAPQPETVAEGAQDHADIDIERLAEVLVRAASRLESDRDDPLPDADDGWLELSDLMKQAEEVLADDADPAADGSNAGGDGAERDVGTLLRETRGLFAQGREGRGAQMLDRTFDAAWRMDPSERSSSVMLELWILRYAYSYPGRRDETWRAARGLLASGARAIGSDLRKSTEAAFAGGHSEQDKLRKLIAVALGEAAIDALE
ncbi:MAG: toll/interleukin-1 receptor domain-containing protein [Neomegalonema sp.]|nr:toll/interleukin-1 receptor domain-containing protein [Neomegalonema sp.]